MSRIGESLGPYRLLEEIGRGGMGVVYKALDTDLRRHVAVKVLDFGLAKHASGELDGSEIHAPSRDLPLTQVGTAVGTPEYMSPEQVEGRPLDAVDLDAPPPAAASDAAGAVLI